MASPLDGFFKSVNTVRQDGAIVSGPPGSGAGVFYQAVNIVTPLKVTANAATQALDLGVSSSASLPLGAITAPTAPSSGALIYLDAADKRLKAIDQNGVISPLDGGWLTFNAWALVSTTYTAHFCELVLTDTSSLSPTITLPDATKGPGKRVRVFDNKNNASTHNITIATTAGQTVNGGVAFALIFNFRGVTYVSDGANWQLETDY